LGHDPPAAAGLGAVEGVHERPGQPVTFRPEMRPRVGCASLGIVGFGIDEMPLARMILAAFDELRHAIVLAHPLWQQYGNTMASVARGNISVGLAAPVGRGDE
jgi:hypothetical protein